jgi:aldose 1-epimerase
VEVGGGLRSYAVDGRELLDGYPAEAMCTSGRGQVLIPWPNRLEGGRYEFDGRNHQLPLTEPEHGNAIHGLVCWSDWSVAEREADRVVVEHALRPQPGYPFEVSLRIEYALSNAGLTVRTTATGVGAPCPYGAGAHPYITLGTQTVDPVVLHVPAARLVLTDAHGIPTDAVPVDHTEYDFREPRPVGGTKLDNAFTDLDRDADGIARVELRSGGAGIDVWMDRAYRYVTLYTGDPRPDVSRRSLAVEPMTCPANAFRSGEALIRLEPGRSFTSTWGITPV